MMIIGLSKETLIAALEHKDCTSEGRKVLSVLISHCKQLYPDQKHDEALIHDAGYADGYNKGFEDGKNFALIFETTHTK